MSVDRSHLGMAALLCAVSGAASAEAVSVNFESFTLGALPGGADARTAGNANKFYVPDNAATSGEVRAGVGLNGSNGLVIGNRGNSNDGVIDNVKTGRLAQSAGAPTTGAPATSFSSSFWFRTASSTAVTDFAFKTETWGSDRTTWLGFFDNGAGRLSVEAAGYGVGGVDDDRVSATTLAYGEWYRVVTGITFSNGAGNDVVDQAVYDANGALLVAFAGLNSWDGYYDSVGTPEFAVDAVGFQARYSPTGDTVYVDDIRWSTDIAGGVPEPGSAALVLIAGIGCAAATRRRARA